MSAYTKGEWFCRREGFSTVYVEARIGGGMLQEIAACGPTEGGQEEQEANARRICACVNACAGIPTDQLEIEPYIGSVSYKMRMQAEQQRDELQQQLEYRDSSLTAACVSLGKIGERLGTDPDEGGHGAILVAIDVLVRRRDELLNALASLEDGCRLVVDGLMAKEALRAELADARVAIANATKVES